MTTHVLIVDSQTFKVHLEYMFAGTGAKDKDVDFNNTTTTKLHYASENGLVAMMADGSRVRKGDHIIFYVQSNKGQEGKFYGIFKTIEDGIFLENFNPKISNSQYLYKVLGKNLTFRFKIEPEEVYSEGVTEWQALDEIRTINSPNQILWSLIYRKLRGNRGNTMITLYEAGRLFGLIRQVNNNVKLIANGYSFDSVSGKIISGNSSKYTGATTNGVNILPRLFAKYKVNLAHEVHLQMYITQNVGKGTNQTLDNALGITGKTIEWLGNEVACGVGMQRIDVMLSIKESEIKRVLIPIELKAVEVQKDTVNQLDRYIHWIEQYYVSNLQSTIQPVLICKSNGKTIVPPDVKTAFDDFNARGIVSGFQRYLPLIYIQYTAVSLNSTININFNKISY